MEVFLYISAAILSLVGLATIIRAVIYSLYSASWQNKMFHVICLEENSAEIALRDSVEQLNWNRFETATFVVAVDCGLSPEMKKICKSICNDINIPLIMPEKLSEIIKGKLINGTGKANG